MAPRRGYDPRSASELIADLLGTDAPSMVDDELGRLVDNIGLSSSRHCATATHTRIALSGDGFPSMNIWDLPLEPKPALLYQFAALCWRRGYRRGTKFWLDRFWESIRVWLTGSHRPRPGSQLPFALPYWWQPPLEQVEPVVLPDLWENEFQRPTRYFESYYTDAFHNQIHHDANITALPGDLTLGGNCLIMPGARIIVRPSRRNPKARSLLALGKYVVVGSDTVIEPTRFRYHGADIYLPGTIGDYAIIGMGARVRPYYIGNFVSIGRDCVIEDRVVIQDGAYIANEVVVPAGTVVPKDC